MTAGKYGAKAERWSEDAYADTETYLRHRGEAILLTGPRLAAGDVLLDLACGDGALADYLPGIEYRGVDVAPEMVEVGRRRGRKLELGDLNDYEPSEPVAATTCFRAVYYASDRAAFFRRVAGYTERKFVFDLNPRRYSLSELRSDLEAAGFDRLDLRPFFSPQQHALPGPVLRVLYALEHTGPLARTLLALRFSYVCAAYRAGRNV